MASVFDKIITQGVRAGQIPARTDKARNWYRDAASDYGKINERKLVSGNPTRAVSTIKPGEMYMFMYDPKYKDTLPYYDRFPLIFPFKVQADRFWGINLHYLPHRHRAILMDALYDTINNTRYDESTKLQISYKILTGSSKLKFFKPCVKQYLYSQLNSKFLYVYPSEWDIALFLPLERFSKAPTSRVHFQSKESIGQ